MPSIMATSLRWRTHSARSNFCLSFLLVIYNKLIASSMYSTEQLNGASLASEEVSLTNFKTFATETQTHSHVYRVPPATKNLKLLICNIKKRKYQS